MYYKELYFQEHKIRFIGNKVVVADVYSLYGQCTYKFVAMNELETIEAIDITNNLECLKHSDDLLFEVTSIKGLKEILGYLESNGYAIAIFKNWLFNYAILYIEDITYLYTEIDELKIINYSLANKLDNLQQKDNDNTKSIADLKFTVTEIKDILLGLVGLDDKNLSDKDLGKEENNLVEELKRAYANLVTKFGHQTNRRLGKEYLKKYKVNLLLRATHRNVSLLDYILSDKVFISNSLNIISAQTDQTTNYQFTTINIDKINNA